MTQYSGTKDEQLPGVTFQGLSLNVDVLHKVEAFVVGTTSTECAELLVSKTRVYNEVMLAISLSLNSDTQT